MDIYDKNNVGDEERKQAKRERRPSFWNGMLCGALATLVLIPVALAIFISLNAEVVGFIAGQIMAATNPYEDTLDLGRALRQITQVNKLVQDVYVGEYDTKKVTDGLMSGYVRGLGDPYSVYYTDQDMVALSASNEGAYNGIGVTVSQTDDGTFEVIEVKPNSPAAEAGMQVKDIIISYDGTDAAEASMSDMVTYIRESKDDPISMTVIRGDEELEITVMPSVIEVDTVTYEMLENGIGHVRLVEFYDVSVEQMKEALDDLMGQGMSGLVIDLRDNPGGTLTALKGIADFFLSDGMIFYTQEKSGAKTEYTTSKGTLWDGPTVVLVNGNSASASEAFTGMMKDHGLATIIGTQTFGKGIMQSVYRLSDKAGIKLTMAHYYTPSGADIHGVGIEPDIVVEKGDDPDVDSQLETAIEELGGMLEAAA